MSSTISEEHKGTEGKFRGHVPPLAPSLVTTYTILKFQKSRWARQ